MINQTDSLILASFVVFFWMGWRRGLIRTVFGPIAFIIASVISYQYFIKTNDLIASLVIATIGPFVLNLILRFVIKISSAADKKNDSFPLGRWIGGFLSMFWEGSLVILTIFLIAMLPPLPGITKIRNNILESQTCRFIQKQVDKIIPTSSFDIKNVIEKSQDPEVAKAVQESQEYADLMNDPRMKRLFSDEELMKQIENRDIGKLINTPIFKEILQDPELIKKFLAINQKINDGQIAPEKK